MPSHTNMGSKNRTKQILHLGHFNTLLSVISRISKNISKDNRKFERHYSPSLLDIYRTFHPTIAECSVFSSAHGILTNIDHISGH